MRGAVALLAAVLLACGGAAHAQLTGSRLPGSSSAMVGFTGSYDNGPVSVRPSDEAVARAREIVRCVVPRRLKTVQQMLAARDVATLTKDTYSLESTLSACLGFVDQTLKIGDAAFRGMLAEAMLDRGPALHLTAVEPSKTEVPYWLSGHPDQRVVEEMAICLADRFPTESEAVVRSAPGTAAEVSTFAGLMPQLGPCLVQGTTLTANRNSVRLALADALYHRWLDGGANPSPVSAETHK